LGFNLEELARPSQFFEIAPEHPAQGPSSDYIVAIGSILIMLGRVKELWYTAGREARIVAEEICPVAEAAKLLGDKWTLIILRDLASGTRRFKDLAHSGEGISPSILAARLRELEQQGIVIRTSYNEIPPRVEYALSQKGHDALPVIDALRVYGERWLTAGAARIR
jgi:DNA-binding HxlR family transcriptional regulator